MNYDMADNKRVENLLALHLNKNAVAQRQRRCIAVAPLLVQLSVYQDSHCFRKRARINCLSRQDFSGFTYLRLAIPYGLSYELDCPSDARSLGN